jgi:MFS-type transporter involved in bile tolerance (Atg22 family)
MNLVLGMIFGAVILGLFARRLGWVQWIGLALWILLLIAYYFFVKRNG